MHATSLYKPRRQKHRRAPADCINLPHLHYRPWRMRPGCSKPTSPPASPGMTVRYSRCSLGHRPAVSRCSGGEEWTGRSNTSWLYHLLSWCLQWPRTTAVNKSTEAAWFSISLVLHPTKLFMSNLISQIPSFLFIPTIQTFSEILNTFIQSN